MRTYVFARIVLCEGFILFFHIQLKMASNCRLLIILVLKKLLWRLCYRDKTSLQLAYSRTLGHHIQIGTRTIHIYYCFSLSIIQSSSL